MTRSADHSSLLKPGLVSADKLESRDYFIINCIAQMEDNIRMGLKEIGINTRNWVDSVQGKDYWRALVNAALNPQVP